MDKALMQYSESIKSPATRRVYDRYLKQFLAFAKTKTADELVKRDNSEIEDLVISYLASLKRRIEAGDYSPNSLNVTMSPIQLLLEQNDVLLNWKKIKRMYPRKVKPRGDLPYTNEDIRIMLKENASKRTHAFIHILASTGCRVGAIRDLKVSDLQEIQDCCAVTFYRGDIEEYIGFLTPEAYQVLKEYFDYRRDHGEAIGKSSPVITGNNKGKPITDESISQIMLNVLKKAKLRNGRNSRHDKSMNHAFRKRFNTILKMNNSINQNITEKLMGHKRGLDGVYLKPTMQECFNEFRKAIPELTLDKAESSRLALDISETEKDNKIEKLTNTGRYFAKRVRDQTRKMNNLESELENTKAQLAKIQKLTEKLLNEKLDNKEEE